MIQTSVRVFYHSAFPHRTKILCVMGIVWLFLLWGISTLPVEKSSTAFFPDSSKTLQSMVKAMEMTSVSQVIYLDFHAKNISMEDMAKHMSAVQKRLDPALFLPASDARPPLPSPDALLSLLPSLFDTHMEQAFQERLAPEYLDSALRRAQALLLGFTTAEAMTWIRHDPLQLRELLLPLLPKQPNSMDFEASATQSSLAFPVSADGTHLLLTLHPRHSIHATDFAVQAMDNITDAISTLSDDMDITVIGGIRHTVANTHTINADILWISVLSLAGIGALYMLFIRSWGGVWLFLTPCFAVTVAFGAVHLMFGLVSGLAVGFGMSILGIAEDYAVHMHFALRSSQEKNRVFAALSTPLFQGFILNASGFALLLFSAIPAVRQLSAFAIVTLGVGLVLALYILPLCPGFDTPLQKHDTASQRTGRRPALVPICITTLLLGCACAFFFMRLPMDVSPRSMGADMENIQRDTQNFFDIWRIQSPTMLLVDTPHMTHNAALERTRSVQNTLEHALPHVRFSSLANILPAPHNIEENIARWNSFIATHTDTVAQSFQAVLPQFPTEHVFAPFFTFLREKPRPITLEHLRTTPFGALVPFFLQDFPRDNITQSRIVTDSPLSEEDIPASMTQDVILFTPQGLEEQLRTVFYTEARSIPLMFLCCFVLLFLCFKNMAQTCLAALPATAALLCIFISMSITGTALTLASLAAMPLVIGLAIDHGIMATHHMAKGMALHMDRAIIVSSLTACVSMGMLAFASHPTLQAMGHVIFVGVLVEMPVAIWLVPKFCSQIECQRIA